MNKILVCVEVPAINKKYDVLIPQTLPICEITGLIAKSIEELSENRFVADGNEVLCSKEQQAMLTSDLSPSGCGIQNGDHLVLI